MSANFADDMFIQDLSRGAGESANASTESLLAGERLYLKTC